MQRVLPDAFSVSHAHEEGLLACLLADTSIRAPGLPPLTQGSAMTQNSNVQGCFTFRSLAC